MNSLFSSFWSSVGKKVLMAFTGLFWILYLLEHLIGNLLLLISDPAPYNKYADVLLSFGKLLWIAEAVLIGTILVHIISGISVWLSSRTARPVKYSKTANAGGKSRKTISSITMIYTGIILLIFMFFHVNMFKFGAHYTIMIDGKEMLDLHRVVYEAFANPVIVFSYAAIFVLLGFHLRHAFWSAFQSLGISHPRYTPFINFLGVFVAVVMAGGFIFIPLYIFFLGGAQ